MRWWGEGGLAPARHWLSLPLWKTQWGLNLRGTGYPCHCGKRMGGLTPRGTGYPRRCGKRNGGLAFFVACRPRL